MVSPHRVVMHSEAIAGQNGIAKAPWRLASTMTIVEAPGKMLASSSRQYQGAGQCGDEIGDSGENWFPFAQTYDDGYPDPNIVTYSTGRDQGDPVSAQYRSPHIWTP